jgi:hypothetical protein
VAFRGAEINPQSIWRTAHLAHCFLLAALDPLDSLRGIFRSKRLSARCGKGKSRSSGVAGCRASRRNLTRGFSGASDESRRAFFAQHAPSQLCGQGWPALLLDIPPVDVALVSRGGFLVFAVDRCYEALAGLSRAPGSALPSAGFSSPERRVQLSRAPGSATIH